jgi:thioredoxin 1
MNASPNEEYVLEVGKANFDSEVLCSHRPVLVVFWARWSSACRVAAPALNEVIREISGRVKLVKINADENPNLSLWYGIQSLPTLLYFVDGVVCARIVGAASKEAILAQLESSTRNKGDSPISRSSNEHK